MEFSERLKDLRKQAGLTQVDVAEKLGISVATVNSLLVKALKKLRQQSDNESELAVYLFFLEKSLISEQ